MSLEIIDPDVLARLLIETLEKLAILEIAKRWRSAVDGGCGSWKSIRSMTDLRGLSEAVGYEAFWRVVGRQR